MIASVELQKAVYQSLNEEQYSVSEVVPANTGELPMITIDGFNKSTNFTKTNKERFSFNVNVHGWSVGHSSIESKIIEHFIYQTMMNLKMDNYDVEFVRLLMNDNLKDEENKDGIVFHSIQQFEVTIAKQEGDN